MPDRLDARPTVTVSEVLRNAIVVGANRRLTILPIREILLFSDTIDRQADADRPDFAAAIGDESEVSAY
ncbi:hypothetical protein L593_06535 [Salinarchaeum sp. Harcht-Bsk1]|nr:hypothetical protein L593_06535 [Salinarchaeum sp. Harcht-Bsk1]